MDRNEELAPEAWHELQSRAAQQRRVIEDQSEVLSELGFDLYEVMISTAPGKQQPYSARRHRIFSFTAGGYLCLNAVSTKVPGPAWWLGIAPHARLFAHLGVLLHGALHFV